MNIIKSDTEPNQLKFSEMEIASLFECRTAKVDKTLHSNVNSIIKSRLSIPDTVLYRGVTQQEIDLLDEAKESMQPFEFGRVTSFTEDYGIARDFAAMEYVSRTIIRLNHTKAFCYHDAMRKIALDVPLEFFNTASGSEQAATLRREEYMDMIDSELEWFVPADQKFVIVDAGFVGDYYVLDCVQEQ